MLEQEIVSSLTKAGGMLAVAESCTGGMIGVRITSVPGSSKCFSGGVISYTNELKRDLLGVPQELLAEHGAVSEPVAGAMAEGAARVTGSEYGLAVTGIAGPGGGTEEKPVGLVYIGLAGPKGTVIRRFVFEGDRDAVRAEATENALKLLLEGLKD